MAIDPFELFCFYHLGLDAGWTYRFRNLHHAAARFGVTPDQVQTALADARMEPDRIRSLDFNLAKAHGDAMELDLVGAPVAERERFARATFERFQAALIAGPMANPRDDVDWDDPLGQGETGN